jgi:amino acid transporter
MSAPLMHAQALTEGVSSAASHGIIGGGASLGALIGIAWLYHHTHGVAKDLKTVGPGKTKHDPRRTLVIAFMLGVLLAAGGGGISAAVDGGAGRVASMLG